MARAVTSCRVQGSTVYLYDENGGLFDVRSFCEPVSATAFGTGVSITSKNLCFTYMLQDGRLEETGIHQA